MRTFKTVKSAHAHGMWVITAAMEEENDCLMEDVILYMQKQRYCDGCSKNEKRIIRRKAMRFTLSNGELLHTKKDKIKVCLATATLVIFKVYFVVISGYCYF